MRRIALTCFSLFFCAFAWAKGQLPEVLSQRLANGLQVLVKVDHRAPVAVVSLWVKVGGSYEHNGLTGISHVLEHMMFQGSANTKPGEFVAKITRMGGVFNAVTTQDYTQYFESVQKDRLPEVMALEADRFQSLKMTEASFVREMQVVKEERRMRTRDNPIGRAYERFLAMAYVNSPYHHPVVGWRTDLDHLTLNDVRQWYRRWYTPSNVVLTVVGDVKPQQVFQLAQQNFGAWLGAEAPQLKPRQEVAPLGMKLLKAHVAAKAPTVMMGFNVPSLVTLPKDKKKQAYALAVASAILAGGDSSRLVERLVRKTQCAAGVGGHYDLTGLHGGLMTLFAYAAPGCSLQKIQQEILAVIAQMKAEPVSASALARVKAQVIADQVFAKDSMMAQAELIGSYEVVGLPWLWSQQAVAQLQAVTAQEVQSVMKTYFVNKNLTVAEVETDQTAAVKKGGCHD